MTILQLIREDLKNRTSYAMEDVARSSRMHANEMPWSPLDDNLNEYPAQACKNELSALLAKHYQIKPNQILLTRGSDEGIDLLMRLFLKPNQDRILQCTPTFSMYAFYAKLQLAEVIDCTSSAPYFSPTVKEIRASWQPFCKIIMLCRPNNPTGSLIALETVRELCRLYRHQSMIVVDEAYIEFAQTSSATSILNEFDNLIVLRTLSKARGLAGLRLGAVIASPLVIQALESIMAPFALSSLVTKTAIRALSREAWFTKVTQQIIVSRERLFQKLQMLPWIEAVFASHANFILIKTPFAAKLAAELLQNEIVVRSFPTDPILANCLRITIGSEVQNNVLWNTLNLSTTQFKG